MAAWLRLVRWAGWLQAMSAWVEHLFSALPGRMDPRSAKKNPYSFEDPHRGDPICGVWNQDACSFFSGKMHSRAELMKNHEKNWLSGGTYDLWRTRRCRPIGFADVEGFPKLSETSNIDAFGAFAFCIGSAFSATSTSGATGATDPSDGIPTWRRVEGRTLSFFFGGTNLKPIKEFHKHNMVKYSHDVIQILGCV